jgi:hypothetical protein
MSFGECRAEAKAWSFLKEKFCTERQGRGAPQERTDGWFPE